MRPLLAHPDLARIRSRLRKNRVLRVLSPSQWAELEPLLVVSRYGKNEALVRQGEREMRQLFILEGVLKRVVADKCGHRMTLRFASDLDMDTSYAARRLGTPVPYSIVASTKVEVAELEMTSWIDYLERHEGIRRAFEHEVLKVMSEVLDHCIALHMNDGYGRLSGYEAAKGRLKRRLSDKDLASYLNLTPETLSRLRQRL